MCTFVDIKRSLLTGYALYELHFFFKYIVYTKGPSHIHWRILHQISYGKDQKRERNFQLLIQDEVDETIIGSLHQKVNQNISGNWSFACSRAVHFFEIRINPFAPASVIALIHLIIIKQEFQLCLNNNHAQTVDPVP